MLKAAYKNQRLLLLTGLGLFCFGQAQADCLSAGDRFQEFVNNNHVMTSKSLSMDEFSVSSSTGSIRILELLTNRFSTSPAESSIVFRTDAHLANVGVFRDDSGDYVLPITCSNDDGCTREKSWLGTSSAMFIHFLTPENVVQARMLLTAYAEACLTTQQPALRSRHLR